MSNPSPLAKMFHGRMEDVDLVTWHVSLNESDQLLLLPSITAKPSPPTAEVIKCCSRFSLPSESSEEKKAEEESSLMEHWSGQKVAKEAMVFGPWTFYLRCTFVLYSHICTVYCKMNLMVVVQPLSVFGESKATVGSYYMCINIPLMLSHVDGMEVICYYCNYYCYELLLLFFTQL